MKKILMVFGTRPEAIKMAPLYKILAKEPDFIVRVAITAQHREMLDQVLDLFKIVPEYDLNMMKEGQTLYDITAKALIGLRDVLADFEPDLVLVHGDTTTTLAASLAAFYASIPLGHVEAGLRTGDKFAPYPEEMNRCLTDVLSDFYFAPTKQNRDNLLLENIDDDKIFITGNTVIDALMMTIKEPLSLDEFGLADVDWNKKVILLTCHRRENWGEPMLEIFRGIRDVVENREEVDVVFPVHKNPRVRKAAEEIFAGLTRVHRIEPLDYHPFSHLMARSYLVLTDSGGIQEEAPALGKPVLVLRDTTERPEAVAAGTVKIAGTGREGVRRETLALLEDEEQYKRMAMQANPYGDGTACNQICDIIKIRENQQKIIFFVDFLVVILIWQYIILVM